MTSFALRARLKAPRTVGMTLLTGCLWLVAPLLTACSAATGRESVQAQSQDALVTARIKAALMRDDALRDLPIQVDTQNRVVALSGFVQTPTQITQAMAIARRTNGASAIRNDLRVTRPE